MSAWAYNVVPSEALDRSPTGMILLGGERELVLTLGLGGCGNGGVDTLTGVSLPMCGILVVERTSSPSGGVAVGS
eukprot:12907055-Prorocentrum_lima.AAC.1